MRFLILHGDGVGCVWWSLDINDGDLHVGETDVVGSNDGKPLAIAVVAGLGLVSPASGAVEGCGNYTGRYQTSTTNRS